jgi:ADP-ribose pyrophosphatase YjhB (NUDIX family)
VLPKGKVKQGMLPHRSARQEAFEEAGVIGEIENVPVGRYRQNKVGADGRQDEITVLAFAMRVTDEHRTWPEMRVRQRRWMTLSDAMQTIRDAELRSVLATFHEAMVLRN